MWPLMKKEWHFIKPLISRLMLLGMPVLLTVLFIAGKFNSDGVISGMTFGFSFMMVYSFVFQSGYQEDKVGGLTFLRSLPVSCKKIVGARYLIIVLLGCIAIIIAFCILYISTFIGIMPPDNLDSFWVNGFSSLASVLIVGSIMLWTYFRFGYKKMGWALLVMFIVLPCLIGLVGIMTLKVFPGIYVVFSETSFAFVMILLTAAVLLVCLFDSAKVLQCRDLS